MRSRYQSRYQPRSVTRYTGGGPIGLGEGVGEAYGPTISELPDPTVSSGQTALAITKTGTVRVYCDGTDWRYTSDDTVINPWWKPLWSDGVFDLENSRYWADGASRALAYFTANGDGSYNNPWFAWWSNAATVQLDYEIAEGATPSGYLYTWHNAANQRTEYEVTSGGAGVTRLYIAPSGVFHNPSYRFAYPGSVDTVAARGRRRAAFTVAPNMPPKFQQDNWALTTSGTATGAVPATMIGNAFGRRSAFNDVPLVNTTLRRVVWSGAILADSSLRIMGSTADARPIHLIGDSFLNAQQLLAKLAERFRSQGVYLPISQDGVGSSSLEAQAVRYALDTVTVSSVDYDISHWKSSTLVIMDGGLSDTGPVAIAAIDSMVSRLRGHDQWVYVQSAPNNQIGESLYDDWLAADAAIRAHVGEDRYIETLTAAQALSNGSAEDIAEIAKGKWPLSLKTSVSDFHPNSAGNAFLAEQIDNRLVARGWKSA